MVTVGLWACVDDPRSGPAADKGASSADAAPSGDQSHSPADGGSQLPLDLVGWDLPGADGSPQPKPDSGPTGGSLSSKAKVIFLHHSTGANIWGGGVSGAIASYNKSAGKSYSITDQEFPKSSPYGWENYPYDYWNIWVNNGGSQEYLSEPTLEILTKTYDVIVFKHCFPVGDLEADTGSPDVSSSEKRIENYKLQYAALKQKMLSFPSKRFIVWTGAAKVKNDTNPSSAQRSKQFFDWVRSTWDTPGDNIFLWDFYQLETEGGLYLVGGYAEDAWDSHPNSSFSQTVAPYFATRVVDVIEGRGDTGSKTGQ
jgi:hypothetical protein